MTTNMMDIITSSRPYLEWLYFIAQIILAGGLIAAIFQINLLKRDMRTRNERAAKEKAIEAAEKYLSDFVNLDRAYVLDNQSKKIAAYPGKIGNFSKSPIVIDENFKARLSSKHLLPTLNKLEAIAAHFVTGVADEATGFDIIGRTYCSAIEYKYDILCVFYDKGSNKSYYSNMIKLYDMWRPRLSRSDLEKAKISLESEIANTPTGNPTRPIGL